MNPVQTVIALLIATGIPIIFLVVIYTLDLYASRAFRLVLICFAWGGLGGLGLSYVFNSYVALPIIYTLGLSQVFLYVLFAPIAEEILKSLSLFYVSRRPEFTYFVDGAIYGFAAGIGFSITENYLYLSQRPGMAIALALTRGFSTCLMHGTAAGLVGAAVGRFRFQQTSGKRLALIGGWVAAILFHALFNGVAQFTESLGMVGTLVAVVIGLVGVGLIAFFIAMGLREQRQWLAETLDRKVGVTGAEVRAAQAYADMADILKPIASQFRDKAELVEQLVLLQAQLGIKRKVHNQLDDQPELQTQLAAEIEQMQERMEQIRKDVGAYVMMYVRNVFPEGALDVWGRLELIAAHTGPADLQRWTKMLSSEGREAPERSIFDSLQ